LNSVESLAELDEKSEIKTEVKPFYIPLKAFPNLEKMPVHFERIRTNQMVPTHGHEFNEIAVVLGGSAFHVSNEYSVEVRCNDVFVVPKGLTHSWMEPHNLQLLNIYYRPDHFTNIIGTIDASILLFCLFFSSNFFENSAMRSVIHFRTTHESVERAQKELDEIRLLPVAELGMRETFCTGCFLKLLSRLALDYADSHSLPSDHKRIQPQVYRLLEILNQHATVGKVPRIAEHAMRLGVSPEHLSRIFTEAIGCPPFKYFNKRRLENAKDLLLKNTFTITEIAYRLGFSDSAHFSRTFKEGFHFTPSEFKRRSKRSQKTSSLFHPTELPRNK
jgi:AraC family transcriptional regulator, L-rhamnose operon transcriptional activator RhaR